MAEPDPDAEPPKTVKFIRGGASLIGIELNPYFTSTQFVIDFAGTFLIYGMGSLQEYIIRHTVCHIRYAAYALEREEF